MRAQKRAEAVESLLEEVGMGKGRMAVIMLKEDGVEQVLTEIRSFFDRIRNLPRQPVVRLSNPQTQSSTVNTQENIIV